MFLFDSYVAIIHISTSNYKKQIVPGKLEEKEAEFFSASFRID